ncbi:hypothetical protein AMTRI_Chr08g207450 [Amborella trichopoda]
MQGREQSDRQWVIDVVNGNVKLNREEEAEEWTHRCIYKIPSYLHDFHEGSFAPRLVSLGPLHHGSPHLQPMEHHKRRALLHFLDRSKHSPDVYLKALEAVERKLRACYEWPDELPVMESPDFLNMMLLDGCFLLELHRTTSDEDTSGYTDDDPVFGPNRADFFADNKTHDLVLLENQIPLLVLQTLLDPLGERSQAVEAHKVAYELYWSDKYTSMQDKRGMHLLHVYQMTTPWGDIPEVEEGLKNPEPYHKKVPSATALHDAGVRFQVSPSDGSMDFSFDGGVLKLPYVVITPSEETFLLNVMAFEQLHVDMDNPISSVVKLMDNLIDTAKDVQLLVDSGIIENRMESDQEVAELFNRVTKGMAFFENSNLKGVRTRLIRHCKRRQNLWRARFVNTYLRDPWTVIALLAAGLLLCLTLLQTVYSVLSYIK